MIEQVEGIALALGEQLLQWRDAGGSTVDWDATLRKSSADTYAHRYLVEGLTRAWPGIPVVSEEDVKSHVDVRPDLYWLIDPIDGTASYCEGFDGFVTQIALMRHGTPVLALVTAPALGLTWRAELGGVALRNGEAIRVRSAGADRTLIDNYPEPRGCAKALYQHLGCVRYIESGSIGLKICRVADGTADLFVKDVKVRDWDVAPAHLILSAAGGCLSTFDGQPFEYAGGMEKMGLIATASTQLIQEVIHWRREKYA